MPRWCWLIAVPYAILYLVHALTPEIQADAYSYHLALPAEWLRLGHVPSRTGFYETLPHLAEWIYLPALALGGAEAAKLTHLAFLAAAAWLLARALREMEAPPEASLLFVCAPVVGMAATCAYNDVMLAFFALASFAAVRANRGFLGGLLAGACYGVKMTGAVFVVAGCGVLLAGRRGRQAGLFLLGAILLVTPWLARNAYSTGNPVAPLFNRWFPNPHFHPDAEERLRRQLRTYHVAPVQLPLEVTLRGEITSGLAGPIFLLAPLALVALRHRSGHTALAYAGFALLPWTQNAGTRMLIPALAFLAMAVALALPKRWLPPLVCAHALLSWPWVLDYYVSPGAWRLWGFPWEAAVGREPPAQYMRRMIEREQSWARLLNAQTRPGDIVLDLAGAPALYTHATLLRPWQHAAADRAVAALDLAANLRHGDLWEVVGRPNFAGGREAARDRLEIRMISPNPEPAAIQEVRLLRQGRQLPAKGWRVTASDHPWEAPLAFDNNPVTRWNSWIRNRPDNTLTIVFDQPPTFDEVRILLSGPWGGTRISLNGDDRNVQWRPLPGFNWRVHAARALKRDQFHFVLISRGADGFGRIGEDVTGRPGDWALERLGRAGNVYLFVLK